MRYEYGRYIYRFCKDKCGIILANTIKAYYQTEDIEKSVDFDFPAKTSAAGIVYHPILSLEYKLSKRVYLDMGLSLWGIHMGFDQIIQDNPLLPPRAREFGGFGFNLYPERMLRVGLSYAFLKKEL